MNSTFIGKPKVLTRLSHSVSPLLPRYSSPWREALPWESGTCLFELSKLDILSNSDSWPVPQHKQVC